jgi:ammonium transporter Rh
MIFIGFGFQMTFLKTHSWTSVGFNFIIACWAIQLNIIMQPAWHMILIDGIFKKIPVNMESLIFGDFAAAAVLITFGAILGKCTWAQLFTLATLEVFFYGLNLTVCVGFLGAVDLGGSMYIHTFGAYFGLASTYFFNKSKAIRDQENRCKGSYQS